MVALGGGGVEEGCHALSGGVGSSEGGRGRVEEDAQEECCGSGEGG